MIQIKDKLICFDKYKSLFRFGIVGIINTSVDFITFMFASQMLSNKVLCQFIGYSCGTLNSFIMNKTWTFEDKSINNKTLYQAIKFIVINAVSLLASLYFINLFYSVLQVDIYISKVFVIVITQLINFLGYRYWVFKK
ncbi:MAG: GtrA family protein [Clostridiales bacterium]|nr:GtrA family protein [Clostridiales bacterium]